MLWRHSANPTEAVSCKWWTLSNPKNRLEKKTLNLASTRFFMLHFTEQQFMISVNVGLFQPKMVIDSDFFGPHTRKISVIQCVLAENEMEGNWSKFKWWMSFWGIVPSSQLQNRCIFFALDGHDISSKCFEHVSFQVKENLTEIRTKKVGDVSHW